MVHGARGSGRIRTDFMFQLNPQEFEDWKSQIVISKNDKMGLRKAPLAIVHARLQQAGSPQIGADWRTCLQMADDALRTKMHEI